MPPAKPCGQEAAKPRQSNGCTDTPGSGIISTRYEMVAFEGQKAIKRYLPETEMVRCVRADSPKRTSTQPKKKKREREKKNV